MLEVAKKAAIEAGEIILKLRGKEHKVRFKGDQSNITTEADAASEKRILGVLQKKFPKHNFWSEDLGMVDNGSEYWWVIDPLDGTGPYFSGMPTYGVSIGLLKGGKPILGVLNFPSLKNIYWSYKGNGAFKNGKRIEVSKEKLLDKVMVGYDFAWMNMREKEVDNLLRPVVSKARYTPILGCTIAGLSYVAESIYGAYIHWAYNWDFVAGVAIIEEAGGKVTDKKGKGINWLDETVTIVASNGKIHDKLLKLIGA